MKAGSGTKPGHLMSHHHVALFSLWIQLQVTVLQGKVYEISDLQRSLIIPLTNVNTPHQAYYIRTSENRFRHWWFLKCCRGNSVYHCIINYKVTILKPTGKSYIVILFPFKGTLFSSTG